VRLAATTTGVAIAALEAPAVQSLAFSATGEYLLTGGGDQTVRLWDVKERSEVWRLTVPGKVNSVALSASGKHVAIASTAGTYLAVVVPKNREVTFPATEVQAFACSQVRQKSLSAEEWKRYFAAEPLGFTCQPIGSTAR
jgi:WD40 repeat protein